MNTSFELKLESMAHGGSAIGRYEGRAIFVPYAIPGERVRVEISEDRGRYATAHLVEVLTPSAARVTPPCPYFGPGKCGGCQWQHIDYQVQARIKGLVAMDQLKRIGKFDDPPVLEPLPDASGWEYRNHALFHTDAEGHLGFRTADSHAVCPVSDCLIIHPLLSGLLKSLDMVYPDIEWLEMRAGTVTDDLMMVLQTMDDGLPSLEVDFPVSIAQVLHDDAVVPLIGLDYITEAVRGREFRISPTSFYQTNSTQAAQLVTTVLEAVAAQPDEHLLDAYCGVGLFAAFLSTQAGRVTGIELNPSAVHDARHNLIGASNVEILEGAVEHTLRGTSESFDAAVIDPPRTGLERDALDCLADLAPARIVYVSCDPATLARDCRRFANHGYSLQWVQPIDLFPQTYHIEAVALLTKED